MPEFQWNALKSRRLKRTRGASFADLLLSRLIGTVHHPSRPQEMMLFEFRGYVWAVPFVQTGDVIFLKTLYPSRKHTRLYREGTLRCDESS